MDALLFISVVIVAVTQIIKMLLPTVQGWLTILVALLVGIVVALLDTHIGLADISVAQGVVAGLGAVGISVAATKAAGNA